MLASIEYGLSHLGREAVVVLGHIYCGAVTAAVEGKAHGYIGKSVQKIQQAIGNEKDVDHAVWLNAHKVKEEILDALGKEIPASKPIVRVYEKNEWRLRVLRDLLLITLKQAKQSSRSPLVPCYRGSRLWRRKKTTHAPRI